MLSRSWVPPSCAALTMMTSRTAESQPASMIPRKYSVRDVRPSPGSALSSALMRR